MIYKPLSGAMWDPSVFYDDGVYYAIMMYNPNGSNTNPSLFTPCPDGLAASCGLIAVSDDGIHWRDGWTVTQEPFFADGGRYFKAFIAKIGDRFIMDHGVQQANGRQDILRFYESKNLHDWSPLFNSNPDPRWYEPSGRWDHMYMLPKNENDASAGYWGYPVATTKPVLPRAMGMMESVDGRDWTILPPPEVQWDDVPALDLEIGGCERMGDKYVIIGGQLHYLSTGYSMYTLISDNPCGPFRPDTEAFRLCGTSTTAGGWGVSFLAAWCRGKNGEKLISNYISVPSGTWMLPLRKAVFEDGHLRLGWWQENEKLKGMIIEPIIKDLTIGAEIEKSHIIEWLPCEFDLCKGVIIEGTICAHSNGIKSAAGFAFSENNEGVMEIRLGINVADECETHIGRWNVVTGFSSEDVTGKGCATVMGITNDATHHFRLLVRHDVFELYIDNMLVQTYVYRPHGGRIGLVACEANVVFNKIIAYAMSLQ
ncbi:MAG: hypothetical protein WCO98_07375 [bacterium]